MNLQWFNWFSVDSFPLTYHFQLPLIPIVLIQRMKLFWKVCFFQTPYMNEMVRQFYRHQSCNTNCGVVFSVLIHLLYATYLIVRTVHLHLECHMKRMYHFQYHNTLLEVPMVLSHSLSPFSHHLQLTFLQEQDSTFAKLAEEVDCARFYKLFDGPATWLVPVFDATTVFSGIKKCIGKMISHATAQCAIGFPHLSPVCYWYIISQDINQVISCANLSHIRDATNTEYMSKVCAIKNYLRMFFLHVTQASIPSRSRTYVLVTSNRYSTNK